MHATLTVMPPGDGACTLISLYCNRSRDGACMLIVIVVPTGYSACALLAL